MLYDFAAKLLLWRKRTSHRRGIKLMAWSAGDVVALASSKLVCLDVSAWAFTCVPVACSRCRETFLDDVRDR
jgi:hypothetical protein